jgi:hypothetical protein
VRPDNPFTMGRSLFSFGHYDTQITMVNDQFKFSKVMAVVDNWSIPHMLSTPI